MANYYTDFSEYTTDAQPSDWTEVWDTGQTFIVRANGSYTGGKYLEAKESLDYQRTGLSWNDVDGVSADQELLCRFNVGTAGIFLPALRASGTEAARTGYILLFRNDSTGYILRKAVAGTETALATVSFTINDNTFYWVRFRAYGTAIKVRVWADGDSEPGTWNTEVTNGDVTGAGKVQVGTSGNTGNNILVDTVAVATGGDTATNATSVTVTPTVISLVSSIAAPTITTNWYGAWGYRVKITVDATKVDADLTNFPVYVDLSDLPAGFHTNVNQTDARDIRVTKADGYTELPREVVSYDSTTDTGELHFKADTLASASDTDFYIYYGNVSATEPAANSTYGKNNAWKSTFKMVAHMSEDPSGSAPQILDSTVNAHHGTSSGTMTSGDLVAGKVGKAIDHDGTNDIISFGDNADFSIGTGDASITGIVYKRESSSGWSNISLLGRWNTGASAGTNEWLLALTYAGSDDKFSFAVEVGNTTYQSYSATNVSLNTYHLVKAVRTGSNIKLYIDGQQVGTTTAIGSGSNIDRVTGRLMKTATIDAAALNLDGIVDELRLCIGDADSDAWALAEYNNLFYPSTFYAVGAQEEPSATTNIEVSPTVINLASSIISPTISTIKNIAITAVVIASAFSLASPTVTTTRNATISPIVIPITSITQSPTITTTKNVSISPTVISSQLAVQDPVISTTRNVSTTTTVQQLLSSVIDPTVATTKNISISPDLLAMVSSVVSPTITASQNISTTAEVISLSSSALDPIISTTWDTTTIIEVISPTLSIVDPAISTVRNSSYTPTVNSLAFSVQLPEVTAVQNSETTPLLLELTSSLNVPEVLGIINTTISATTLDLSSSIVDPTVLTTTSISISPSAQSVVLTIIDPVVTATSSDVVVYPSVSSLKATIISPKMAYTKLIFIDWEPTCVYYSKGFGSFQIKNDKMVKQLRGNKYISI